MSRVAETACCYIPSHSIGNSGISTEEGTRLMTGILKRIGWAVAGILLAGALLDALVNARTLFVSSETTYWGTAVVLILGLLTQLFLRTFGLGWKAGRQRVKVKGLGISIFYGLFGVLVLLWAPRLFRSDLSSSSHNLALAEHYSQLAEQLGAVDKNNEPLRAVRVAAIAELGAMATEYPEWRPQIIKVLCTYLRINANRFSRQGLRIAPPPEDWMAAVNVLSDSTIVSDSLSSLIDLTGAMLYRMDLSGARLRGATLAEADFFEADLSSSDLRNADLSGALLIAAFLNNADLRNAYMIERDHMDPADLAGADFDGADLRGAQILYVRGLESGQLVSAKHDSTTQLWDSTALLVPTTSP
jgi:hypothetical protein